MGEAEAKITRQLDGLIEQLEAGNSRQAEPHAQLLFDYLVYLTTTQPDPTKLGHLRLIFPAHQAGLDATKTRALRFTLEEVLEMIRTNDLSEALDNCRKAREFWTTPKE